MWDLVTTKLLRENLAVRISLKTDLPVLWLRSSNMMQRCLKGFQNSDKLWKSLMLVWKKLSPQEVPQILTQLPMELCEGSLGSCVSLLGTSLCHNGTVCPEFVPKI